METNTTPTYYGWANYETWAVYLRLTNQQPSSAYWAKRAREILDELAPAGGASAAVVRLREELCNAVWAECFIKENSLAEDLLAAALGEVNWHKIAQSFIDNLTPTEARRPVPLGRIVATRGALRQLTTDDRDEAITRHAHGDWGDVNRDDWAENDESREEGWRLQSIYHSVAEVEFWIITEADRSVTTILLPDEY